MTDFKNVCAVTGANGYLGSRITKYLRNNGAIVYELIRNPQPKNLNSKFLIPFSLEANKFNLSTFENIDILIHCAYDFQKTKWRRIFKVNVEGSLSLFKAAIEAGVKKIIFISTMSAFEGCKSLYGKAKLEIEKEAKKLGVIIIRPGLIFGENSGGVFGSLNKLLSISPVIPLVGKGKQKLYMVHEEDLCRLVLQLCLERDETIKNPIIAASIKGKSLKEILRIITEAKGKNPIFIPIPWRLIWVVLKANEMIGIRLFRSDSLISLVNQDTNPCFEITRNTLQFREFSVETLRA